MAKLVIPAAGCKSGCGRTPPSVHSGCGKTAPKAGACGTQDPRAAFVSKMTRDAFLCEGIAHMAVAESGDGDALTEILLLTLDVSDGHCAAINAAAPGLVPVDREVPHKDLRQKTSWERYEIASSVMTDEQRTSGWDFGQVVEWTPEQKMKFIMLFCLRIHERALGFINRLA